MTYILAVDGGGSKTHAVIVDQEGHLLSEGFAGRGNHQVSGIDAAMLEIRKAIQQALQEAALTYTDITFAEFGLAGADREHDLQILRPALAALPFEDWEVVCDTMEGLRVGSDTYQGVVLVCGMGTNAAGRNEQGDSVQTGGFGYLYGDAAGGQYLASETFRLAIRSWERREQPSVLPQKVADFYNKTHIQEVLNAYLDDERTDIPADLNFVLHEAAAEGDALAISLLKQVGRELGYAALSVIERLGGFKTLSIPIVLTGSILQKGQSPYLMQTLEATIKYNYPDADMINPKMEPVYGAVMLAMDHLNITVTERIKTSFERNGGIIDEETRA